MTVLLLGSSLIAGVLRTTLGVGAGIFLTACLGLVFEPRFVLAVTAILQLAFDVSAGYHFWGAWDRELVAVMGSATVAGVVSGSYLLAVLPALWVRRTMGALLCAYAVSQLPRARRGTTMSLGTGAAAAAAIGFLSGAASALANVSGVILAIHLLALGLSHSRYMGSLTAIQFIQDIVKIVTYTSFGVLGMDAVWAALPMVPCVLVGGGLGVLVNRWIPPALFRAMVLGVVTVSGLRLLLQR